MKPRAWSSVLAACALAADAPLAIAARSAHPTTSRPAALEQALRAAAPPGLFREDAPAQHGDLVLVHRDPDPFEELRLQHRSRVVTACPTRGGAPGSGHGRRRARPGRDRSPSRGRGSVSSGAHRRPARSARTGIAS